MNTILHFTIQNTGSKFLWDLLMSHPDVSAPDPKALGEQEDSIWRDKRVAEAYRTHGGWGGIEDLLRPLCKTSHFSVWTHNSVAQPLAQHLLSDQAPQPNYVVGCVRDPLLMLLSGLARIQNPNVDLMSWTAGRALPWQRQFFLWQQGKINLLPVDLWGSYGLSLRRSTVKSFLEKLELTYTQEIDDYVGLWERSGEFVHSGSPELVESPIKGKSQQVLEAYYHKDLDIIEELIGPWLRVARVIAGECKLMFDGCGYNLWWHRPTPRGV